MPQVVTALAGKPIRQVAANVAHSLVLTTSGRALAHAHTLRFGQLSDMGRPGDGEGRRRAEESSQRSGARA